MTDDTTGSLRLKWDEERARELAGRDWERADLWEMRNALRGALAEVDKLRDRSASAPLATCETDEAMWQEAQDRMARFDRRYHLEHLIKALEQEPDLAKRFRVALTHGDS